jgi:hypothetical protein
MYDHFLRTFQALENFEFSIEEGDDLDPRYFYRSALPELLVEIINTVHISTVDDFGGDYLDILFGTNIVGGLEGIYAWKKVLARIHEFAVGLEEAIEEYQLMK